MSMRSSARDLQLSIRSRSFAGLALLEIVVSAGVFLAVVLSVSMTLGRGIEHRRSSFQAYRAVSAIRDVVAEIQEVANLPHNATLQEGIAEVYGRYHGQTLTVPGLSAASVALACFANEQAVPVELGGPQDLNYDGDADDDLGNQSNGTDLRLVPLSLTLTYDDAGFSQSVVAYRLIARTTD